LAANSTSATPRRAFSLASLSLRKREIITGYFNHVLRSVTGLTDLPEWFRDPDWAMTTLIII